MARAHPRTWTPGRRAGRSQRSPACSRLREMPQSNLDRALGHVEAHVHEVTGPPDRARPHPERVRRGLPGRGGAPLGRGHGGAAARGRPRERAPPRDARPAPLRLRGLAARRGRADAARLRPPRRSAAGPPREVGHAGIRAGRARRPPVRPRCGGRQGHLHHPRRRRARVARDRGPAAPQPQAPHRGRGGDRLAGPRGVPEAVRAAPRRRRRRPGRHRQLRRGPPCPDLPAARHLPGGRRGALPGAARPQRLLGRSGARRRAHPRAPPRRSRASRRLAEHPGALPLRGPHRRAAAPPHPRAAVRGGEVPALRGDEARHAPRRGEGLLRVGASVDAGPPSP